MKTCRRFERIRDSYERDIRIQTSRSHNHPASAAGQAGAGLAYGARKRMAQALNRHLDRCPECG
ncbi:hypothetical protein [Streptomyces sp. NPDC049881]|uniref:hypothetical protein n=1 Tax=unclassified Streptomyces TaxID=2593676 RepID=UPI00343A12F0